MEQDNTWKDVVEELFEAFLFFFFPDIHKDIDFAKGYAFLDKELQQITGDSETGGRVADKLAKVRLVDGTDGWLLIHFEIQGYVQKVFPERMFVYNYRIFDKYRKEVISLAILTDDNPNFRPNEYRRARWGFEISCRYPIIKLLDYRDRWAELETSSQPFAIIVMAFLKTLETEGNVQERYTWKKRFLLELYQRGLNRETILAVYKFIDWVMKLSKELNTKLVAEIQDTEETKKMSYITTAERMGIEKSMSTVHQAIALAFKAKFGETGQPLIERVYRLKRLESLQTLLEKLSYSQSLPEAEKVFDEIERHNNNDTIN